MLQSFQQWMTDNSNLSNSSVYKYVHGFNTVSKDMLREGIITKPLSEMSIRELDLAITVIFNTPSFIKKNKTGNNMYSNALKQYRCFIGSTGLMDASFIEDIKNLETDVTLKKTDREVLTKARIGQGIFREHLLEKYSNRCIITGIAIPEVLIASHIKPWAVSSNEDRLSVDNGLLLSATYDRLFDSGLISFKKNGEIVISGFISREQREILHLVPKNQYELLSDQPMLKNLEYHRDVIFVK